MPVPCTLCGHPDKASIEQQIASKELSITAAARMLNCNKSSVSRHLKNHLGRDMKAVAVTPERREEVLDVINTLRRSHEDILKLYDACSEDAKKASSWQRSQALNNARLCLGEERKHLELYSRLTGGYIEKHQIEQEIEITHHPKYQALVQLIVKALEPFPAIRWRVADAVYDDETGGVNLEYQDHELEKCGLDMWRAQRDITGALYEVERTIEKALSRDYPEALARVNEAFYAKVKNEN
jgi:predicted transcriptional regulator